MISHTKSGHLLSCFKRGPSQLRRLLDVHPVAIAVGQHGAELALVQETVKAIILQRLQCLGLP